MLTTEKVDKTGARVQHWPQQYWDILHESLH